jgi:hypothetical protein
VRQFLYALLNGCWIRRGQVSKAAYARIRLAYSVVKRGGDFSYAARVATKNPISEEIWGEALLTFAPQSPTADGSRPDLG